MLVLNSKGLQSRTAIVVRRTYAVFPTEYGVIPRHLIQGVHLILCALKAIITHNTNVYAYKHTVALGKSGKKKETDGMDHIAQSLRTPHVSYRRTKHKEGDVPHFQPVRCESLNRTAAMSPCTHCSTAALQQKRKESVGIIP